MESRLHLNRLTRGRWEQSKKRRQGVVPYAFNPGTLEGKVGACMSSKPARNTRWTR